MNINLYTRILEEILNESVNEASAAGGSGVSTSSITGMSLPLGKSPEDYSDFENKENPIKKKRKKKRKTYSRSVQYYLKNDGEKSRKRNFK